MSTDPSQTTQPTEGYDQNYYGDGYNYAEGGAEGDPNAGYYDQYDAEGNYIGGYDNYQQDGYDPGGNPMNQLNETGADAQYQQQQQQEMQPQYQHGEYQHQEQPKQSAGLVDQEMSHANRDGTFGQQQQPPQQDPNNQGYNQPPPAAAPAVAGAGAQGAPAQHLTLEQQRNLVINQSGPGDLRQQLNQLLGKSPGTALKEHEPESDGGLADITMAIGTSLGFKLYFMYLLWSSLVLFTFIGYDYIYATLYRMMIPPDVTSSTFGQSTAYLCIFFSMSFFIVSVICVHVDMMRDFWTATTTEPQLWGIKIFEKKGPWPIYALLIITNFVTPMLWSIISTAVDEQSIFFFISHFAYSSQAIMCFTVLIVFIWFWFRAGREKGRALARRKDSPDECGLVRQTNLLEAGGKPDVLGALNNDQDDLEKVDTWWKSDIVMQEWGMDQTTVLWMIVIFSLCFAPLLIILVFLATEGDSSGWNAGWLVLAVIFFCVLILLHQTAMSRRKKGLSAVCSFLGLGAFIAFGLIGGGAAGSGALVGVFVVILLLSQGMLTRKRLYDMTRREIYHHFKQPFDEEYEDKREKKMWDSYCCCCKSTMFACCRCCFDINKVFGFEYPEVHKLVKKERKKRVALRTDQNFLALFWWILCIALLVLLAWARLSQTYYGDQKVAVLGQINGSDPVTNRLPVCTNNLGGPLTLYEMSLLASLGLSAGGNGKNDFDTWFKNAHPRLLPDYSVYSQSKWDQSIIPWATWTSFAPTNATAADTAYISVRGQAQGASWMNSIDQWSDSIVLQVSGVLAPHVQVWPSYQKATFVNGVSFLKRIYGGVNMIGALEAHVRAQKGPVILVGHGFAGAIAQIVAARTGHKAVGFNPPGIGYLFKKFDFPNPVTNNALMKNMMTVSSARSIYTLLDMEAPIGARQQVDCPARDSHQRCTDMTQLVQRLKAECGDAYGRRLEY